MAAAPPGQVIVTVGPIVLTCNFDPSTLAYTSINVVNTSGEDTSLTVTVLATSVQTTFTIHKNSTTNVTKGQLNAAGITLVSDAAVSI